MNTKEQSYLLFKKLCSWYEIDIEQMVKDNPKSRSGTLGTIMAQDRLFNIYRSYLSGDYDIAYIKGYEELHTLFLDIRRIKTVTPEVLYKWGEFFNWAAKTISEYNTWNSEDRIAFKEYIFSNPFLTDEDKTDENFSHVNKLMIDECKNVINSNYLLRTYVWKQGSSHIDTQKEYEYVVSNTLVISDDMDILLSGLKMYEDDKLHYTFCFKIEEIIDYSYFIIAIQYGDTIYISSDFIPFSNPRTKASRRNPQRTRESWWDKVGLPYGIIDDIIKWRKEKTELTSHTVSYELYIKSISDYLPFINKVYLWILSEMITEHIATDIDNVKQIYTLGKLVEQTKMLPGSSIECTEEDCENTFSKINYETSKRYQDNLWYPGKEECKNEIIRVSTDLITKSESYDSGWLVTADEYRNMGAWFAKEEMRKTKQSALSTYAKENKDSDTLKLKHMLWDNRKDMLMAIMSGEDVYFYDIDTGRIPTFGMQNDSPITMGVIRDRNMSGWKQITLYQDWDEKHGWNYKDAYCSLCGDYKTREGSGVSLVIEHYEQLCMLLGCTRKELPGYFRNYTSYRHIPYYGNSILDNTNPEFLVDDPASRDYPNGYRINLRMCGYCFKENDRKYKQYDSSLILWSSKHNMIVDIVDYNIWREENEHLRPNICRYI